jgi:hypothetical protein
VRCAGAGSETFAEVCTHHLPLTTPATPYDAERYRSARRRDRGHVEALEGLLTDDRHRRSDHWKVKSATTGTLSESGQHYSYGLAGAGPRCRRCCPRRRAGPVHRSGGPVAAENPARLGHYPAKGALAPGSHADIVIFDPDGDAVLPGDGFGDGTGDSVYTGLATHGRIRSVLLRGELIVSDDVLVGGHRHGRYLPAAGAAR